MSALFQSVAQQLGQAGGDYAKARDVQTEQKNKVAQQLFEMQQKSADAAEQKRMDDLTAQVQGQLMKQRASGTWEPLGSPLKTKDGGYSIVEHNSATGEVRTRPLPAEIQPQNADEQKWDDYRDAYKKAFGKEPDDNLKTLFFNKEAGAPAPKDKTEFDEWREAFKAKNGRYPNASEISEWHRAPKADGAAAGDDLGDMAQAVADKQVKLPAGKLGVQVLGRMKKMGLSLPAQLNPAVEDRLMQRADALDIALDTIERIKPNLDLLKSLPNASLVELSQHSDTLAQALSRYFPNQSEKTLQLAGDLRSLKEQVNIIRGPLGATGFRGKEGWDALQMQTVRAMGNPAINAATLGVTEATMKKLRDSTLQILGEPSTDNSPGGPQPTPSGGGQPAKPHFVKDPKTDEMVEQ